MLDGKQLKNGSVGQDKLKFKDPENYTFGSVEDAINGGIKAGYFYITLDGYLRIVEDFTQIYFGFTSNNSIPTSLTDFTEYRQLIPEPNSGYNLNIDGFGSHIIYIFEPLNLTLKQSWALDNDYKNIEDGMDIVPQNITIDDKQYRIYRTLSAVIGEEISMSIAPAEETPNIALAGFTSNDLFPTVQTFFNQSFQFQTGGTIIVEFTETSPRICWFLEPVDQPIKTKWYISSLNNGNIRIDNDGVWRRLDDTYESPQGIIYRVYVTTSALQFEEPVQFRIN